MRLESVKVYQYVQMNTKSVTFFTIGDPSLRGLEIDLNIEQGLIKLTCNSEVVYVPMTNVQYFKPYRGETIQIPAGSGVSTGATFGAYIPKPKGRPRKTEDNMSEDANASDRAV